MAAERETTDRLVAAFLADRVGAEFAARISGVTRSGLFVRLQETGADGFVPAATIGNDYYRHHEDAHALIGDRTGETYRLGDDVNVRLVEAIPTAGALRFEMLSEGKRAGAGHVAQGRRAARGFRGHSGRRRRRRRLMRRRSTSCHRPCGRLDGAAHGRLDPCTQRAPSGSRMQPHERIGSAGQRRPRRAKARALRPRDAATLIIVDDTSGEPRVLLGRRRLDMVFMPGRYVFPGGRVDRADRQIAGRAATSAATTCSS